jgi:hypothetical protein
VQDADFVGVNQRLVVKLSAKQQEIVWRHEMAWVAWIFQGVKWPSRREVVHAPQWRQDKRVQGVAERHCFLWSNHDQRWRTELDWHLMTSFHNRSSYF